MRPALAVLRIAKVKAGSLDRLSRHDTRAQPVANDDPERGGVVWLSDSHDPARAVRDAIATLDKPPRANATIATQTIITARADWFGEGSTREERAEAFTKAAMDWARKNLLGEIVAVCRHDGEAAPHLHIWSVPISNSEIAVNRKRPELGKRPCRRLDYRGLYGKNVAECRATLSRLQDGIGEALAPLGIQRGKKRTGAEHADHKTTQQWKAEILKARLETTQALKRAEAYATKVAALEAATRASNERAEAALARAKAWEVGQAAVATGRIIDADGPENERVPVFAPNLNQSVRDDLAQRIAPAGQKLLAWIAEWAALLRHETRRRLTEMIHKSEKTTSIQAAAARAAKAVDEASAAMRRPNIRKIPERER
jgi:Plasmid recombination enzyme